MIRRQLSFGAVLAALALPVAAQEPGIVQVPERTANSGNVVLSSVPDVPPEISARLQRYQNTRSAAFAAWTPDGRGLYITTRFAAVPQLHRVDMPGGMRRQLTFADEPIRNVARRPGRAELLYSTDTGGGEFFQLFLFDPATAQERRLTDDDRSRNMAAVWSPDGQRVAFTSTRRDGRSNDVWVVSVDDTAGARPVLQTPDGSMWVVTDWHPDGERLLVANYVSATESRVHVLDLRTGQHERVAGGEGQAVYLPAAFAPDGNGMFLITDAGGEHSQLAWLSLADREVDIFTADIPWSVDGFMMSTDRRRAAFVTNEGGVSRLYLLDPVTRRYRKVESVPMGILSGGDFSPDGRRLAFTLNSASSPSDVFSIDLADDPLGYGGLIRWTHSEVGGLDPERFVTPALVEYPSFDERRIPAFVYRPDGAGPHPVVISIHGGPEGQSRPDFSSVFQSWASEFGIAVVDPNVRGSSGYGRTYIVLDDGVRREDAVRDIGALLDWISTQPDLDQDRVMVYGGSYGGYMVLASLMHYSDRLRGGVNIVGISDFISFLENTEAYRRDLRRVEYGDERDPEMRAFFERISPLRNAHRITTPLFVIHGQNDPRVPITEAEQIVEQLRARGRPVWFMRALNEGHGFARRENQDLMRDLVVLFFQQYLLPPGAAGAAATSREQ
jgi:dipeptidyl aminopeptidase/acylaminoacyl peptidase